MPYINAEQVRTIRKALKKALPTAKFSVRKEHYSSVNVTVLKSDVAFDQNQGVNPYHYQNHDYTDAQKQFLNKIFTTIQEAHPKHVISEDADYGSIPNYYLNVSIRQQVGV